MARAAVGRAESCSLLLWKDSGSEALCELQDAEMVRKKRFTWRQSQPTRRNKVKVSAADTEGAGTTQVEVAVGCRRRRRRAGVAVVAGDMRVRGRVLSSSARFSRLGRRLG